MLTQQIRRGFLRYFKERGHTIVASSPVVPHEDPTLLFTNAGMNQFKDVFLGKSAREYTRAATSQKCVRVGGKHNDLDNVGHTSRHLTFFEMMGNFSFGDYFKEQAIAFAWEVSTAIFAFDSAQIWITVFEQDDEAFALWKRFVPESRIVRFGEKDNFWAMGETGPCGPCSELYYDRGARYGSASSPQEDPSGERYLEFWNLVFMQYNRDAAGKMSPLPKQSIDTGAGLERVVSLKMGVDSVFATDLMRSLIAQIETVSRRTYDASHPTLAPAFHVIADHIRSLAFAIADGAQPSNVERGYVLRKLLRRAVRYGRMLGMEEPFLAQVLPRLIEMMGPDYHELVTGKERIAEILTLEEESFLRTLKRGGNILSSVIEKAQKNPYKQISGEEAFKLKDTYGLPLEEVLLIAKDTGLQVNLEAYQLLEEKAKELSRSAKATHLEEAQENLFKSCVGTHGPCLFVGYETTEAQGMVTAILAGGQFVDSLSEGEEAWVVLQKTPFYAEMGGQVGDRGNLAGEHSLFEVTDCRAPYPGVIAHIGTLQSGSLRVGQAVLAKVDAKRRQQIANHHTATHLLHWALHQVLGPHVRQAGSLVEPSRLRFDFSHHKAVTPEQIRTIEKMVNEKVRADARVQVYEISYEEAQKHANIKQFFGEKYGSKVRVIDIDFSKELCGGTHVQHTGHIGLFRIAKESSVAAGTRRIEALAGEAAEEWMYHNEDLAHKAAALLKVATPKLPEKTAQLLEEHRELSAQLKGFKQQMLNQLAQHLTSTCKRVGSVNVVAQTVELPFEELAPLAERLLKALPSALLLLAAKSSDRCQLLVRVSPDLTSKGVQALALIQEIAPLVGGSGGGRADSAQAGGKNPAGLPEAFAKALSLIQRL